MRRAALTLEYRRGQLETTMNRKAYCRVSAMLFTLVALAHLSRLVNAWPVTVADMSVPMLASWIGLIVPGALAAWGFRAAR